MHLGCFFQRSKWWLRGDISRFRFGFESFFLETFCRFCGRTEAGRRPAGISLGYADTEFDPSFSAVIWHGFFASGTSEFEFSVRVPIKLTNRQTGRDILFRIGRLAGTNFWYRRINDCKRGSFVANFNDGTVLGGSGMKFGPTKSSLTLEETATETNSSSSSLHPHCCRTLVIYPLSISSL